MLDTLPVYVVLLLLVTATLAGCGEREYKTPPRGDQLYNAGAIMVLGLNLSIAD
jgi:type IV pilus biogenesis protein CpaD/CtpE